MRITSDPQTNKGFELLANRISKIASDLAVTQSMMQQMMRGSTVNKAGPHIPFRIAEEGDSSGIFETVDFDVPGDAKRVRLELISVFHNTKQSGETDDAAIARAKQHIKSYTFRITDTERMAGRAIRQIGPFKYRRDDATKNQYQLTLVTTKNIFENAVQENPSADPYKVFPFTSFVVRTQYDDGTMIPDSAASDRNYFAIGDVAITTGPSVPDSSLIVGNAVNLETQAADADVTFKVFASNRVDGSGNHIDTFGSLDISDVHVILRPFADADDATGATDEKLKFGGPITDSTKTFVLITATLPLGKRYKWVRTTSKNAEGIQRGTAPATVSFYAGGDPATAGIPEIKSFTISTTQKNNEHTLVTVSIEQFPNGTAASMPVGRAFATLLKRLLFTIKEPGDAAATVEKKISLLDEEAVFVQGATTVFTRKIKHRANLQNIMFGATIVAINSTAAVPIKRDATPATGNSTYSTKPSTPASNLISTAPDDDTVDGNDAYADFTVYSTDETSGGVPAPTKTFRELGTDHVAIVLRKSSGVADDDPDDMRIPKKIFPIEEADLDKKFIVCRVRDLKLGRNYIWRRNLAFRSGIHIASASATIPFRAGLMALDPKDVAIDVRAVPKGKRHSEVTVLIGQTQPAVLLKNIELWQADTNTGNASDFVEVRQRSIKSRPEFQMTVLNGSGTVNVVGATVTGTGTKFLTELKVGGMFICAGQVKIIQSIASNTSLTLDQGFSPNVAGQAFTYVNGQVWLVFRTHVLPKNATRFFARLRAVGNITKDSATVTMGGTAGGEAPTDPPSWPASILIEDNKVTGDMGHGQARVTFRIYADMSQTKTFDQTFADGGSVILIDPSETDQKLQRINIPFVISDGSATFVDVQSPVLTAGRGYKWRRNILTRNGVPAKSMIVDLMFYAGGSPGTSNLPELTGPDTTTTAGLKLPKATLNTVTNGNNKASVHQAELVIDFTQAETLNNTGLQRASITTGSATVTGASTSFGGLQQPRVGYTITIGGQTRKIIGVASTTSLTVDSPFTSTLSNQNYSYTAPTILIKRIKLERSVDGGANWKKIAGSERLLDQPEYQFAGPQQFVTVIHIPKKMTFLVRATIVAVADETGASNSVQIRASMTSGDEKAYEDNGTPQNNGEFKARWTKRGHLRARCRIGGGIVTGTDSNMNTHTNTLVMCYFRTIVTGITRYYYWNPLTRSLSNALGSAPAPLTDAITAGQFLCDIGRTGLLNSNHKIPKDTVDAENELDPVNITRADAVFNDINGNNGTLFFDFYVFTQQASTGQIYSPDLLGTFIGQASIAIVGGGINGWQVTDSGISGGDV